MSSTIFSSNTSQQKWAEKLNDDFIVYVENPPSIFQVPKSISDTNPEAYAPQVIGIGPYHHFRRDLDHMESRKFAAIKRFLKPEQFHDFKSLVVDKVRAMEPSIRSCYDKYLDLDSDALAWAMAIDGVYLIHLLTEASPDASKIARDVLMMENQFPITVLNEIRKVLCAQASGNSTDALLMQEARGRGNKDISELPELEESDDVYFDESEFRREKLFIEMLSFCRLHSPLDDNRYTPENSPHMSHILGLMYRLVVLKLSPSEVYVSARMEEVAAELTRLNSLKFIANLPLEEFFGLFGNANSCPDSSIEEIQIPSVSQLHRVSRIQFEKSTSGRAVRYVERRRMLYLPVMRLNTNSEVVLRNLVAYELALGSDETVVSSYVDLMCGLIDTAKDVDLLKEKGIIITDLPSEEVAKMFNGINKSSGMVVSLEKITQKLNEAYDSTFRVRCFRFLKNYLIPSKNSVKLVLWILMVSLLVLQAFCQIYGCSDHWLSSK